MYVQKINIISSLVQLFWRFLEKLFLFVDS